jgi:CheY-like chemotaxis protein
VPRCRAQVASAGTAPEGPAATVSTRVLVVDDDARVLDATGELLEGWGCEVRRAADSAAAERCVGSGWVPDLVLADYGLGEGPTGLDLLASLRDALGEELPAALLTAETAPHLLARMREAGFPVLRKPVKPARLRALLGAATGGTA